MPRPLIQQTKPCEFCGKPVTKTGTEASQRRHWTCGQACSAKLRFQLGPTTHPWQPNRFRGQRETRPCARCGKPATRYVTEQNHDQDWFCSADCARRARAGRPAKRNGRDVPCPICGTPFYQFAASNRPTYCSRPCSDLAKRKNKLVKACEVCGAEMVLHQCQESKRFCSRRCAVLAKIKRPVGRMHNGKPVRQLADGYVKIWQPDHHRANKGWVLEHIYVMEQALGRPIPPTEEVDHKNGDRGDNRPENLQVLSKSEHRKKTGADSRTARMTMREKLAEYERRFGPLS